MRLAVIPVVGLLMACSAPAEPPQVLRVVEPEGRLTVQHARALWSAKGPRDYRYVLRQQCFCPEPALRPVVVAVRDGEVSELVPESGEGDVPDGIRENARPVPGWFDYIEAWQDRSPARLEVSYDHETGMPERIHIDRHAMMSDDEITWHLRDLVPLSGKGGVRHEEVAEEVFAAAQALRPRIAPVAE